MYLYESQTLSQRVLSRYSNKSDRKELDLSKERFLKFEEDALDEFTSLEHLNMENLGLRIQPTRLFKNLTNLKILNLKRNKLVSELESFNGLCCLEELFLSENGIGEINPPLLATQFELRELKLDHNKLTMIRNMDTFKQLSKLMILHLNSNQIVEINARVFASLSNLKILWLDNNKLTQLDPNTFVGLSQLEELHLGFNEIDEISSGVFDALANLKQLHLNDNKLRKISVETFKRLNQLEILNLFKNNLNEIASEAFDALAKLNQLHLNDNKLRKLDAQTFKGLNRLEILNLESNKICEIAPGALEPLSNVRVLNLNSNALTELRQADLRCLSSSVGLIDLRINNFPQTKTVLFYDRSVLVEWNSQAWINIDHDWYCVSKIGDHFSLHGCQFKSDFREFLSQF